MVFNLFEKEGAGYDASASTWFVNSVPATVSLKTVNNAGYPSGWVSIRSKLERKGSDFSAKLIVKTSSSGSVFLFDLPVSLNGNLFEVICLPDDIVSIEFQPMNSLGSFKAKPFEIIKIGFLERLYRQYFRVLTTYYHQPSDKVYKSGLRWHTPIFSLQKAYAISSSFRSYSPVLAYSNWIERFDKVDSRDKKKIRKVIRKWTDTTTLHVVIIDCSGNSQGLKRSLDTQLYASFKVWALTEWLSERTNFSEQGWVVFIEDYVQLRCHALFWLNSEIRRNSKLALIYSDHDRLDESGDRIDPVFKPEWSPELLFATNYIGGLIAVNLNALLPYEFTENLNLYELAINVTKITKPYADSVYEVKRIPAVLFHDAWMGSYQPEPSFFVKDMLEKNGVSVGFYNNLRFNKIIYKPLGNPLVSIIIPTRDMLHHLERCVFSVLTQTLYSNFEILIVDNQSNMDETLQFFEKIVEDERVKVIPYDYSFNYSAINNFAASKAQGDFLCLLNNDTEVITPEWLDIMLGQLQQPNVGAVGAKLLFANGTVQHAGDAVGPGGCADHFHIGLDGDAPGYQSRAIMAQDLSAVTAACLLTSKEIFNQLNGLDEENLAVAFNDVDYCLRIREHGKRIVFTPYAKLYHHESATRGKDDSPDKVARSKMEADYMRTRWKQVLRDDPFYNPNLNYSRPDFTLSNSPLVDKPWNERVSFWRKMFFLD
ncbi:glycosyltransferase family 2 protein [uncultured Amphritea sp.]|uniref:glycosyltransferase family 2 protein n=1 Tax=uncultured Amphritea sp. TaxID=981605 RepID=UPI002637D47D|nr:glycosyltransferase family 2 protein [uncultured Amphritea sp.]